MIRTGYVRVDGTRLYYEIAGEGSPLVLIHDGLLHSCAWEEQFEVFAASHRVVRYDRRGYGLSERPEQKRMVIPNAGHLVYLERPEVFNRLLLDSLQRHRA